MSVVTSVSPQAPDDVVVEVPQTSAADVVKAAGAARAAQRDWWRAPAPTRAAALGAAAAALRARAEEAAALVVREVGKPRVEAVGEVGRAVAILEYYAQAAYAPLGATLPASLPGLLLTERRPHGVAGLVTPWNFPLAIPLWKAAPALAAGNAVLLKPSPDATGSALWLAALLADVLPADLFRVLPGGAETGSAICDAADVVSFTGSVGVGRQVVARAAQGGAAVQAEMGGQNAAIVLHDADPGVAAAQIAAAAMGFAGQKCTATRRVVVVGGEQRASAVVEALVAAVQGAAARRPVAGRRARRAGHRRGRAEQGARRDGSRHGGRRPGPRRRDGRRPGRLVRHPDPARRDRGRPPGRDDGDVRPDGRGAACGGRRRGRRARRGRATSGS